MQLLMLLYIIVWKHWLSTFIAVCWAISCLYCDLIFTPWLPGHTVLLCSEAYLTVYNRLDCTWRAGMHMWRTSPLPSFGVSVCHYWTWAKWFQREQAKEHCCHLEQLMNPHIITCQYITNQFNLLMFAHFYEHLFYFRIDISHQRLICFHSSFSLLPLAHFFFHHHFLFFLSSRQLILSLLLLISLCPTLAPLWLRPPLLHPLLLHPLLFLIFIIILLLLQSFHPHHLLPFIPSSSSSLLFTCLPFVPAISYLLPFLRPPSYPPPRWVFWSRDNQTLHWNKNSCIIWSSEFIVILDPGPEFQTQIVD